jgi:hypothetical protein
MGQISSRIFRIKGQQVGMDLDLEEAFGKNARVQKNAVKMN